MLYKNNLGGGANEVDEDEKEKHSLCINNNYTQTGRGGLRENTEFWFLTEDGIYHVT